MLEKWKSVVDKAVDLSKAFDCHLHDFLCAKLKACGKIKSRVFQRR